MRFRKTKTISKGTRVNFSKTGISVTTGTKGLSVSSGNHGAYLNTGIPGTGIYGRTRLDRSGSRKSSSSGGSSSFAREYVDSHILEGFVNDEGEIQFRDWKTKQLIEDEEIIRAYKRSYEYKEELPWLKEQQLEAWERKRLTSEQENDEFINIHKLAPIVLSKHDVERLKDTDSPEQYIRKEFEEPAPTESSIRQQLEQDAETAITGLLAKRKRREFVEENLGPRTAAALSEWDQKRKQFYIQEDENEAASNARFLEEFELRQARYNDALEDNKEHIVNQIEEWLSTLSMPVDISVAFDYSDGLLYVDLDLPEIEDIPSKTTKTLASGKVKEASKTKSQLREDYARCVFGIALFLSSCLFNINVNIVTIVISGYTQRRNKKGDLVDDYIFSVIIERADSEGREFDNPELFITKRKNRLLMSSGYTFKAIEPFDIENQNGDRLETSNVTRSRTEREQRRVFKQAQAPDVSIHEYPETVLQDAKCEFDEELLVDETPYELYGITYKWTKCEIPNKELYIDTGFSTECVPGIISYHLSPETGEVDHEMTTMYVSQSNMRLLKTCFPTIVQVIKDIKKVDAKFRRVPDPPFTRIKDPAEERFPQVTTNNNATGYAEISFKEPTPTGKSPKYPIVIDIRMPSLDEFGARATISFCGNGDIGKLDGYVYFGNKSAHFKATRENGELKPKDWEIEKF